MELYYIFVLIGYTAQPKQLLIYSSIVKFKALSHPRSPEKQLC